MKVISYSMLLADNSNDSFIVKLFMIIGVIASVIAVAIALVWVTCFVVKLLVKSFNFRVGKSYEILVEDISKKTESKKQRNEIKRKADDEQKLELLNMKLASREKIHEMKKEKLSEKLEQNEKKQREKLFGKAEDELREDNKNTEQDIDKKLVKK